MNEITKDVYKNLNLLPKRIKGWNSNHSIFEKMILKTKPNTIIEVGTWLGASAIHMSKICKKQNLDFKIYCIDTWLGAEEFWTNLAHTSERNLSLKNGYPSVYFQFLSNVVHEGFQDNILPFPNTSTIGYQYLKYKNIVADLIYIDGSHLEDDVSLDLKNYWQILKKDGIIFGDDYSSRWPGIINATNNFASQKGIKLNIEKEKWWMGKS